jgi:hypothetical protein
MNDEKIIVIERLRKLIDDRKAHIISDAEHDEIYEKDISALEAAIKEITYRVSAKPRSEPNSCGVVYRCPQCRCCVIEPIDSYCIRCGQAIDWNGTAEEK